MKASIFEIYVKVYFYIGSRNRTLLPSGLVGKESACNAGDPDWVPGSRRSPEGENGNPLLPGEFHGQRSLVGNSPWGHKELDTTGQLTHFSPLSISSTLCLSTETPFPSPTSNHYLNILGVPLQFYHPNLYSWT